jgi:glutamyl-tRNA synthetase
LRVAGEILNYPEFFLSDEQLMYDPKDVQKRLQGAEVGPRLQAVASFLESVELFTAEHLETAIHKFAESQGLSLGDVIHPLRVAVTGRSVGLGLFETLAILGRETVCKRLNLARQRFCQSTQEP